MGGAKTRKELSEKVKKEFFNEKGKPQVSQIVNKDGSTSKLYIFPDKSTITIGRDGGGGPKLEISDTVRKTFEKITFKK